MVSPAYHRHGKRNNSVYEPIHSRLEELGSLGMLLGLGVGTEMYREADMEMG